MSVIPYWRLAHKQVIEWLDQQREPLDMASSAAEVEYWKQRGELLQFPLKRLERLLVLTGNAEKSKGQIWVNTRTLSWASKVIAVETGEDARDVLIEAFNRGNAWAYISKKLSQKAIARLAEILQS